MCWIQRWPSQIPLAVDGSPWCCVWAVSGLHRSWVPPCFRVLVWAMTGSKSFPSASFRPLCSCGSSVCEEHPFLVVLSALPHSSMLCTLGVHWWRRCPLPTVISAALISSFTDCHLQEMAPRVLSWLLSLTESQLRGCSPTILVRSVNSCFLCSCLGSGWHHKMVCMAASGSLSVWQEWLSFQVEHNSPRLGQFRFSIGFLIKKQGRSVLPLLRID